MRLFISKGLHGLIYIGKKLNSKHANITVRILREFDKYQVRGCNLKIDVSNMDSFEIKGKWIEDLIEEIKVTDQIHDSIVQKCLELASNPRMSKTYEKGSARKMDYYAIIRINDYASVITTVHLCDMISDRIFNITSSSYGSKLSYSSNLRISGGRLIELDKEEFDYIVGDVSREFIMRRNFITQTLTSIVSLYLGKISNHQYYPEI